MTTPRLRPELRAIPVEEDGIKFFDVSDPRSGGQMRLYDFEWLLASQMDGTKSLDEVASWAREALEVDLTPSHLGEYADKLKALGFFNDASVSTGALGSADTPLPPHTPGSDSNDMSEELDMVTDAAEPVTTRQDALPPAEKEADFSIEPPTSPRIEATVTRDRENTPVTSAAPAPMAIAAPAPAPSPSPRPVSQPLPPIDEDEAPKKSGSGSMIGLLVVLLMVAAVIYYVMFMAPGGSAKVSIVVAKPGEVMRVFDEPGKVDKADAKPLSFGESGKVIDVVAAGTEVKEGMPLATLESYSKVEKELADVKDRLGYYQKQLEAAASKSPDAQKSAEGKVNEKKKLLGELEARAGKLRLLAPGPGVVEKVHVSAGAEANAGSPAVELTDKRVVVMFKLTPETASALKTGEEATLKKPGGTVAGKISKIDNGVVSVEVAQELPADAMLHLVKSRLPGVITVPAAAVTKKNGVDVAYVLSEGTLHERKVGVADRTSNEAYISTGIGAGDMVVTSSAASLSEGQKASAEP